MGSSVGWFDSVVDLWSNVSNACREQKGKAGWLAVATCDLADNKSRDKHGQTNYNCFNNHETADTIQARIKKTSKSPSVHVICALLFFPP